MVSHGVIHNFPQLLTPLFLMFSIFSCLCSGVPSSVQVAKPEARSCRLPARLNRSRPLRALGRHPEERWGCVLATGAAAGDWGWESELLFIFMAC